VKRREQEAQQEATTNSFEAVARRWFEINQPRWATVHSHDVIHSLERDVFPMIGTLGGIAFLTETPGDRRNTTYFNLVLEGRLEEARNYYYSAKVDSPNAHGLAYAKLLPRSDYFNHWGSAFANMASMVGLPVCSIACQR
jgi:hypothetical protein